MSQMRTPRFVRNSRHLAHRAWTERERRIVWRGLSGRLAIAIEPFLGMFFMGFLTWGIVWRSEHVASDRDLIKIAWIFGIGAIAFAAYFVAVLIAPFIAYLQTFKPIFILDGYVRYRGPDERSSEESSGYVAALFEDRSVACEWEFLGSKDLEAAMIPAHLEFSRYAGIHRIDGVPTGVLPDGELPLLAIGIASRRDWD